MGRELPSLDARRMRAATHDQPRRSEPERRHEPTIVCGVDGSVHARAAARLASALAARLRRRLVLVHAVTVAVPPVDVVLSFEEHRQRALDAVSYTHLTLPTTPYV